MNHLHQALEQVRKLQKNILDKQKFKGYSGRARAIGGTFALLAAFLMSTNLVPDTNNAHLTIWMTVLAFAMAVNFGALLYWFFKQENVRSIKLLQPAINTFPAIFVGAVFTVAMVKHGSYDFLFGAWVCLFGLVCMASRHVLPNGISRVGWLYISFGSILLIFPVAFTNPWPMGLIFFCGEWFSGLILHFDQEKEATLGDFFWKKKGEQHV